MRSCFAWPLFGGLVALALPILSVPLPAAESTAYTQASLTVQSANPITDDRQRGGRVAPMPDPIPIPIPSALSAIPLFALAAAVAARWRHRC